MFYYTKAIVLELCVEIQNLPCQWSRKHNLKQGRRRRRRRKLALKSEKKIKCSATDLLSDSLSYSLLKRLVPFVSWSRCYKAWVLWQAAKSRYHVLASGYCGTISGRDLTSRCRRCSDIFSWRTWTKYDNSSLPLGTGTGMRLLRIQIQEHSPTLDEVNKLE